jgi:uncharacterized membrane protein
VPVALLVLSAIPLTAGTLRLIQLAGGPAVIPADSRFASFPLPLVVHIVGASTYALIGILQFVPRFRRSHLDWHRRAGRLLAVAGLLVAISALWMTLLYEAQPGTGSLLFVLRLIFGFAMAGCLVLGVTAVRRRDIAAHRAWMIRAYAIGLAAGTQAFTAGIGGAIFGTGVLAADLAKGAAWVINLAVAEWTVRRPAPRPPPSRRSRNTLEQSHDRHCHDLRVPRRRPPRPALVRLARRPDDHPPRRRHHSTHRLRRRSGTAARHACRDPRPRCDAALRANDPRRTPGRPA